MEQGKNLKGLQGRSEEVEMLMGQTPNWIFRWGMTLIAVIVAALFSACWFIPWPDTMAAHGVLEVSGSDTAWYFRTHVGVQEVRQLRAGMEVRVTLDVKDDSWGYYQGILLPLPVHPDSTGRYPVSVIVSDCHTSTGAVDPQFQAAERREEPWMMDATATIMLRQRRLLPRLLGID